MNISENNINHISDTPLWVAVYRAKESRRLKREMPMAWLWRLLSSFSSKKRKEYFSKLDFYFVLLGREKKL